MKQYKFNGLRLTYNQVQFLCRLHDGFVYEELTNSKYNILIKEETVFRCEVKDGKITNETKEKEIYVFKVNEHTMRTLTHKGLIIEFYDGISTYKLYKVELTEQGKEIVKEYIRRYEEKDDYSDILERNK